MKKKSAEDLSKREEMVTYKALALPRTFKSKVKREKAAARGVYRIIGGDDPTRPYLRVLSERYRDVRMQVTKEFLQRARAQKIDLEVDAFLNPLARQIDLLTYARIAAELELENRLAAVTVQGRQLTKAERENMRACAETEAGPTSGFASYRGSVVDEVMAKLQQRQRHNPAHYQTVWAEVVGMEMAQQSRVERMDEKEGVVYFRCFNSTLSYHLQRQPELPKKLTKALGFFVRKVVAAR